MSGTVGCTSQSMAARAPVMGSSLVVGLDVRRLGDLTLAEHFLAHPGVEFLRRVAGGRDTEMTQPVRKLSRIHHTTNIGRRFVAHRRGHVGARNQWIYRDDDDTSIGQG